jgi:ferredoxin
MSKKDGKTVLLKSVDKKGFFTVRVNDVLIDSSTAAANACPVKIIQVRES